MPMVTQPLRELQELRKMDDKLLAVRAKNKIASFGSSHNGCATSQRYLPRDFAL
jgi:hypothetical protein